MTTKRLIVIVALFLLGPVANAADEYDFAMQMLSPQTSVMDVGPASAEYMTASLEPMDSSVYAGGRMRHIGWYDNHDAYRQSFLTIVAVRIPNKLPGLETLDEAMGADVRLRISHDGVAVAECQLAVTPIISRSAVYFAVDLAAIWDEVRPNRGICDIDLNQDGLQVGIPVLRHKDRLMTYVRGKPYLEHEFLEGYCY